MLVLGPHTGRAQAYISGRLGALLGSYNQSKKHSHNLVYHYTKEVRSLLARACLMSVYLSYGTLRTLVWFSPNVQALPRSIKLDLWVWTNNYFPRSMSFVIQSAALQVTKKSYVRVAIYLLFTTVLFHEILPPLVSDFIFVL